MSTGHGGDGERGSFSGFCPWPTKWQPSAQPVRLGLPPVRKPKIIDPPVRPLGDKERDEELRLVADYAVHLLVEKAHLVGWQRVEFVTALMDAANDRLSALEPQPAQSDKLNS